MNRTFLSPPAGFMSLTASLLILIFLLPAVAHSRPRGGNWTIKGNANIDPAIHFLGTTDFADLVLRTNNQPRMTVLNTGQVEMTSGLTLTSGNLTLDSGAILFGPPPVALGPLAVIHVVGDHLTFSSASDLVLRTDGLERMRILQTESPPFSDLDGLVQIFTNLRLNPGSAYSGDLIMPWGRWIGRDLVPGGGANAGDLTMTKGDMTVTLGEFSVTNEDGLVLQTISDGPDTRLVLDMADLWVQAGNAFLGPKPGNPPGSTNKNNLFVSSGQLFIGDKEPLGGGPGGMGLGPVLPPVGEPVLRIDGFGDFGFGGENHHVVFIKGYDNPADNFDTPDGISIQLEGLSVNGGITTTANNFLTFCDASGESRGAIEGFFDPGAGNNHGVTYKSGGADFAEYLEKMDPADTFQVGEIVGVFAGRISKQIDGADHILVITGAPVVLGNAPQANMEHLYEKVAFLGQVPTLVSGVVKPGDYIVPSGLEDGTGRAVSAEDLALADLPQIIGTAWSESDGFGVDAGFVNVAIGLKSTIDLGGIAPQQQAAIHALRRQLAAKGAQLDQTQAKLDAFEKRLTQLEAALAELTEGRSP